MTTLTKDHNNHPANSPLTSRRLHQMRDILSKASAQRDGGDIGYAMSDAVKLIDEVLAGRDAKPVIIVGDDGGDALSYRRLIQSFEPGTKLYIIPQPASVVPEELLSAMEEVLHISDRDHDAWHRARNGIAACRSAMLQAGTLTNEGTIPSEPVSEPYKLPATLIKAMQSSIDQLDRRAGKVERGYPQHSHSVSGVCDQSNGRIANEPCSVCALWDEMREYLMVTPLREVK